MIIQGSNAPLALKFDDSVAALPALVITLDGRRHTTQMARIRDCVNSSNTN